MNITITKPTPNDSDEVDELLWKVLWNPIDLPKDIRNEFKLDGEEITLAAKDSEQIIGIIVANKINHSEYEIRHIAVNPKYQKCGIGKKLIYALENILNKMEVDTVQTIARNSSQSFFETIGFVKMRDYRALPKFLKFGISFVLMKKKLPSMTKINTKINYNQIADKYDCTRTSNSNTIDLFQEKLKFEKETKILDFGCGTGNYLRTIFNQFGCKCFGIEPSDSMREIAKQKSRNAQIENGSHELIPFPDNEFDFVYMTDVIHHVPDMNKMFSKLNRVIKPSGLLCIVTESHDQIKNRFYNKYFPSLESVELKRYPGISVITEYAVHNSFVIEEIQEKEDSKVKISEDFIKLVSEKGYSMFRLIDEDEHITGLENLILDFKLNIVLKNSGETLIWLKN